MTVNTAKMDHLLPFARNSANSQNHSVKFTSAKSLRVYYTYTNKV